MLPAEEQNASGDGIINGMVTYEDGRSVMEGVDILLLDTDHNPLTYDLTNEDQSSSSFATRILYFKHLQCFKHIHYY